MSTSPLTWSIESKTWTCTQPNCGPKPNLDMYAVGATIQLSLVKNRQSESYSCFTQNWRPFASKSTSISLWPKVQLLRFLRASLGKDYKYGATGVQKQFICKQSKKPIDEELIWTIITENKDHCSLFCFVFQDFCLPSFCTTIPGVDYLQLIRSTVRVENFEPYLYSGSVFDIGQIWKT